MNPNTNPVSPGLQWLILIVSAILIILAMLDTLPWVVCVPTSLLCFVVGHINFQHRKDKDKAP